MQWKKSMERCGMPIRPAIKPEASYEDQGKVHSSKVLSKVGIEWGVNGKSN